jgi:ferric-dicitrate binding protein FerR (iron transport regulator)
VTLVGGDLARITQAGLITVAHDAAVDTYTSWTRGQLTYTRAPMHDVVRDLERWYDVTIMLGDSAASQSLVTITLDTESLDQALALLGDANDIQVTRRGRVVTMSSRHRRL